MLNSMLDVVFIVKDRVILIPHLSFIRGKFPEQVGPRSQSELHFINDELLRSDFGSQLPAQTFVFN
ncbi:unnamed protein product [Meloidogyne enterolobii]|uniref:Uncharacterized protein n=1 Tax=Meloidogyne enterolobii TaxID=390850 RepID=A0ACB0XVE6_MELEN